MFDVLVVDPNESIRKVLTAGLSGFNFMVMEAASHKQAQQQLANGQMPFVAIVDYTRDDQDAKAFLMMLRDTPQYQNIKVLIATVNTLSTEEKNELAAEAVFVKPIDLSQLVKAVYFYRRPTGPL